jgi:carboxyl-terminal processing protease
MKKIILAVALGLGLIAGVTAKTRSSKSDIMRNLSIFTNVYKELQTSYVDTIDADKSMNVAITAMLRNIDPYTEYYPADRTQDLTQLSTGQYAGVGSIIMQRDNKVVFSEPYWGAPARNAGIHYGDVIVAIDGDTLTDQSTSGDASKRLKGSPGTDVNVTVSRVINGRDSIINMTLTRETIKINSLPYYGVVAPGVGYIKIDSFNDKTAGEFRKALLELIKNDKITSLVIDLKGNGGGVLDAAVQIAGNFVPKGTTIVTTKGRNIEDEKSYKTTNKPVDLTMPLAVLIDGNSASASEILAGSLQDLDRAVIVGQRSYGKGLVQQSRPIAYDGMMKVTVSRYYIPSGRLIQAIDYSHRDEDGRPVRIADSLTRVFKTLNGREVRDGGGITPDVKVDLPEGNRLMYNIVSDMWSWDFTNRYVNDHPTAPDVDTFVVDDTIFNAFKASIDPAKFKYDRASEEGIKYLRDAARIEGYDNDSVKALIDKLEVMMRHDLNHDLDFNRKYIVELLDEELSTRWYSDSDCVKRSIPTNEELKQAINILADQRQYGVLLSPRKDKDPAKTK